MQWAWCSQWCARQWRWHRLQLSSSTWCDPAAIIRWAFSQVGFTETPDIYPFSHNNNNYYYYYSTTTTTTSLQPEKREKREWAFKSKTWQNLRHIAMQFPIAQSIYHPHYHIYIYRQLTQFRLRWLRFSRYLSPLSLSLYLYLSLCPNQLHPLDGRNVHRSSLIYANLFVNWPKQVFVFVLSFILCPTICMSLCAAGMLTQQIITPKTKTNR